MISALRPLEWVLLGVAALLGLLMAGILSSIGDAPQWLPAPAPDARTQAAPKVLNAPSASLDSLAGTCRRHCSVRIAALTALSVRPVCPACRAWC